MDKVFNPEQIEAKWAAKWESEGCFAPNSSATKPYCIMIPPPNVTGSLHMGHAFQDTLMDALIRYHRMSGHKALWQVGTDHAGIATQMVVERQLQKQNLSRHDLGREKFVEKIWEWKQESGGTIAGQLRRMGASVDWSRERFTMDEGLSKAVQKVFIELYNEGLIYRGQRLVNWDPVLHTAISDLEVVSVEEQGSLWHINYPLENESGHLTVATTRPETMLGDTAVAVHPEDKRYQKLIGKNIKLPLTDRLIPIIADDYVDQEFGTGCVKITPAHDFNDYEVGQRHNLEKINILTADAKINENAPKQYQALDRFEARKQIVKDLEQAGLLDKIEKHTLKVPRGDRSQSVVEPYLTDQWFVKVENLAKPAIDAVKSGDIKFVPENWSKTYFEWMNNIQDWCISRQLWWGHRIPAWYDDQGNIYVGTDEAEIRKQHNLGPEISLKQDNDVLDTWFSSALWPFSTLGWPEQTPEFKDYYPTNVLVTGFDIIFFWVARMIMFGIKFTGQIPFKEVYIHGLIQDQNGQKMSKSKGNVIDPLDLVDGISLEKLLEKRTKGLMQPKMAEKITKDTQKQFPDGIPAYGTDALRFTFFSLATQGRELRFELKRLESYRNFCNKLWNAARYVLMQDIQDSFDIDNLAIEEKWILSSLNSTKRKITEHYKTYRFDFIAQNLYEFVWNEYCDWFIEISKHSKSSTKTLKYILEQILVLLHPIMPFITEEIWSAINSNLLISYRFPADSDQFCDQAAIDEIEQLKNIVTAIRTVRAEMNISPNEKFANVYLTNSDSQFNIDLICALSKIQKLTIISENELKETCATAKAGKAFVHIPLKDLIKDPQSEINRLHKDIAKIDRDLEKVRQKLANKSYIEKAPEEVVAKEQAKLIELEGSLEKLQISLRKVENL